MSAPTASSFSFTSPHLSTLWASARRFPFAAAACFGFALLMILNNHNGLGLPDTVLEPLAYGFFAAFFATLALGLTAEAQGWPRERLWLANTLVILLMLLWVYGLGPTLGTPHFLLCFALLGLCSITPQFCRASDEAYWVFNQQSFYGLGIGGIAVVIFQIGLAAVLWALSQLFGAESKFWLDLTILIYAVFWPLYTLTFVPRLPLVLTGTPGFPGPLSFVLSFVALPVLLLYGAIISVYGVQVAFLGHTPVASVSWMVIGFAAAGVALHTLLYPLREVGNVLVRFYYRFFYYLLVPLLGLLFWAVLVRVQAYGVTENRYLAMLGGLWAAGLCLIWLVRGRFRLFFAPASLAVLLVLASFGPWGAENVAFVSQERRLTHILQDVGLLQSGKLVENADVTATWVQRRHLSSLLDYFHDRRDGQFPLILLPVRDLKNELDDRDYASWQQLVMKRWGLGYVGAYDRGGEDRQAPVHETIYYNSNYGMPRNEAIDIQGFSSWLPFLNLGSGGAHFVWANSTLTLALREADSVLVLADSGRELGTIDLLPLLKEQLKDADMHLSGPVIEATVSLSNTSARAKLRLESLELQRKPEGDDSWRVVRVSGVLLYSPN